jgi:hypothetical protein
VRGGYAAAAMAACSRMSARRTFGAPVVIFQSLATCDGRLRAVVFCSQPLGSDSRMILCQAEPTCCGSGAVW